MDRKSSKVKMDGIPVERVTSETKLASSERIVSAYRILFAASPERLQELVQEAIGEGSQPHGNLVIMVFGQGHVYAQVVVEYYELEVEDAG